MKYKYVPVFISYDKVADKMNHLAAQGYEYDKEAIVAIRMKKVSETSDKQYKFIFDKNFTPEIEEYYKVSGWKLYKFQVYNLFRLAEGTSSSYPIYTDTETELEIVKYRLLRFIVLFILISIAGLFIMKLTDENKIEMYRLNKEGYSYKELSKKFKIDPSNVRYMVKLADIHGETVLIKGKNNYYPPELKLDIINEVLILGHSIKSTSLKYALPNPALLSNWISKFKENGYNILEKPRGRTSKMKNNNKKIEKNELSKVEQLEKELEYLRAENAVLKKLREIRLKQSQTKRKQK